jgi:hypothetical protein
MSTDHKKGDRRQFNKEDEGGDKKQDNSDKTPSRTTQNSGHGGHKG